MADAIPSDVKTFVARYVGSVQQLEILLLLSRGRDQNWTVEAIGKKLGLGDIAVRNRLINLHLKGFINVEEKVDRFYRYKSGESDGVIKKLERLFEQNPVRLIELILSKDNQLQNFSDAFRLRDDE